MATRRGPDGSCRISVAGLISGEVWANVFWVNLTGGNTALQADLNSYNQAFYNAYGTNLLPQVATSVSATSCTATLFQNTTQALHSVVVQTKPGTSAVSLLKDNAASKVISWSSNVYWRGGKPRTYLPGIGDAETTDGKVLVSATVTAVAAAGNAFRTAVNALSSGGISGTQFGFVSFMSQGADLNPGVFHPITAATAHPRIGSQRGRLGPWKP